MPDILVDQCRQAPIVWLWEGPMLSFGEAL